MLLEPSPPDEDLIVKHTESHPSVRCLLVFEKAVQERCFILQPPHGEEQIARAFAEGFIKKGPFFPFQSLPLKGLAELRGEEVLEERPGMFEMRKGFFEKSIVWVVKRWLIHLEILPIRSD